MTLPNGELLTVTAATKEVRISAGSDFIGLLVSGCIIECIT